MAPLHRLVLLFGLVSCLPFGAARGEPQARSFDTPVAALQSILPPPGAAGGPPPPPVVVAFGEYHETKSGPAVKSALRRFTEQILPAVGGEISDMVVETWITEGHCGEQEQAVVKDVDKTTQRPVTTETEIVTMVKQAKLLGAQPHALDLSCADYKTLLDDQGQVDYDKMLRLLTVQLQKKVRLALGRTKNVKRLIAVYGGGLHNDIYPREELRDYTFGLPMRKELGSRFLEVDLYVPEYIEHDKKLRAEPWYAVYSKAARPGKATLVERGPGSYIILFPRTASRR